MTISIEAVKELREKTGISIAECRKALEETSGDMEKALEFLKERSAITAAKKSDRELGSHAVAAYIHPTGGMGVLVDLMCETDFVSGNDEIKALAKDIAMQVASMKPLVIKREDITEEMMATLKGELEEGGDIEAKIKEVTLFEQPFVKNPDLTIGGLVAQAIQKFGENVVISHMTRYGN
ncbi:MAG: elongation factor Ts [Minisyncoccia bacterium]